MITTQLKWSNDEWIFLSENVTLNPQLCLLFGSRFEVEKEKTYITELKKLYPNAQIVTTSTAGNIFDEELLDDTILATCVEFTKTTIDTKVYSILNISEQKLGEQIATDFLKPDLANVLLFSTMGLNAGNLLNGINTIYKGKIPVSGGVAGDDLRFEKTLAGLNENITESQIVVIGFYSKNLVITHGSKGGWDRFGPIRKVTKCKGNILFEIDNKPVLDLYKEYLGDKAAELPSSGLLFPFAIIDDSTKEPVVRGIQNVDEDAKSLILYGDVVEGQSLQLMRANFDQLISGAAISAQETLANQLQKPNLAILVSCVARRIVLGQMTEEELVETKNVFGSNTAICGFYSYSEISPVVGDNACHLHNQTMTITTFFES